MKYLKKTTKKAPKKMIQLNMRAPESKHKDFLARLKKARQKGYDTSLQDILSTAYNEAYEELCKLTGNAPIKLRSKK